MEKLINSALILMIIVLFNLCTHTTYAHVACMDNKNSPVDWFIVYKLPEQHENSNPLIKSGVGSFYMDANNQDWTLGSVSINDSQQAVGFTLQQIYSNKDLMYIMYNDEHPDNVKPDSHGHTKGVLSSDTNQGFWLVHSVPKFPPEKSYGKYAYPHSGTGNGQSFLCITLNYSQMDTVGNLFLYNYPSVYDYNLSGSYATDNPNLAYVVSNQHSKQSPTSNTTVLTSMAGQKFQAFAKSKYWGAVKIAKYIASENPGTCVRWSPCTSGRVIKLYSVWIAPFYESDLNVETWPNGVGNFPSNCTGKYKVYNNKDVSVTGSGTTVSFKETKDHSKWAITVDDPQNKVVCIGDINRQHGQLKRGGGTVCMDIQGVYAAFKSTLKDKHACNSSSNLYWKKKHDEHAVVDNIL